MKTSQWAIIIYAGILGGGCGKLADSHVAENAKAGDSGFMLSNAVFVDGTKACGGFGGTTVKFAMFDQFRVPDPADTRTDLDYSACTRTPSNEETEIDPSALNATAAAPVDTAKASVDDNANKFMVLCQEASLSGKVETLKAIENALGAKFTQIGATNQTPVALTPVDTQTDSTPAGAQVANSAAGAQSYTAYCQNLYSSAKTLTVLDLSGANPPVSDVRPLRYLPLIKNLNLSGNPIQSAVAISTMTLEYLETSGTPFSGAVMYTWK